MDVKVTPENKSKVRVMTGSNYNYEFFQGQKKSQSPLLLKQLSPIKSGRIFFNPKTGSSAIGSPIKLDFTFDDQQDLTVQRIKSARPLGTFSLTGQIIWQSETRTVNVGSSEKQVREAKFLDETGPIDIPVWGDPITALVNNKTYRFFGLSTNFWNGKLQLVTTLSRTIDNIEDQKKDQKKTYDWKSVNMAVTSQICWPEVVTVKVDKCVTCRNKMCRRKIVYDSDNNVV